MIALAGALILSLQGDRLQPASLAQSGQPPTSPQPPPAAPPGASAQPAPEDIDLLPSPATPNAEAVARQEELDRELRARRKMLQLHQLGGMLMLASLGATVVFGELNYIDKYGGGGDTGRWYTWHTVSAITSAVLFAGTGALALFAPSPLEKRSRLDTAMLHRIAMGVATAGMVTQVVLGFVTAGKGGSISQRDYALAHQIVGFATFGATAVGFGVLTF